MSKSHTTLLVLAIGTLCFLISYGLWMLADKTFGSEFPDTRLTGAGIASSTAYALAFGASQRVIASSTPPGTRIALTMQAINCSAGAQVWLNFNDAVAATNTMVSLAASSTVTFGDQHPVPRGSVTAVSAGGTCGLNIIEWRLGI